MFLQDLIKAHQMRLINHVFLLFICVFSSCSKPTTENKFVISTKEITKSLVEKAELKLNSAKGQWFYKNQPFNGYAVTYHENDNIAEKTGFLNGKREGESYKYFSDRTIKNEAYYIENKLHGVKLNYFKNGDIASESNYFNGKREGFQRTWFSNGQLAKKKKLKSGKEEGLQQAWLENGKLYVNYEAKNGRVFGMRRANSCYRLEDEVVIRRNQ